MSGAERGSGQQEMQRAMRYGCPKPCWCLRSTSVTTRWVPRCGPAPSPCCCTAADRCRWPSWERRPAGSWPFGALAATGQIRPATPDGEPVAIDVESGRLRAAGGLVVLLPEQRPGPTVLSWYRQLRHASVALLCSPRAGVLRNGELMDELRALPTVQAATLPYRTGDTVPATADLFTQLGYLILADPDEAAVETDYNRFRALERQLVIDRTGAPVSRE